MRKPYLIAAGLVALTLWTGGVAAAVTVLTGNRLDLYNTMSGASDQTITSNTALTGAFGGGDTWANLLYTRSDDLDVNGHFVNALGIWHNFGGAAAEGGRQGINVGVDLQSPTAPSNPNRNYVGVTAQAVADSSDGGSGSIYQGGLAALNPVCILRSAATNMLGCSGGEVNLILEAGSSAKYKVGWSIVAHGLDKVRGQTYDTMLGFSGQPGAVQYSDGILFAPYSGTNGLKSGANVLRVTGPGNTLANGINMVDATVTGYLIVGNNTTGTGGMTTSSVVLNGAQVVGPRKAAISSPSGGAVIDSQCRSAVNAILNAMRASTGHGLISG